MRTVFPVGRSVNISLSLSMVILSLLLITLLSCGRRGDPVAVEPRSEGDLLQREDIDHSPSDVKEEGSRVKEKDIIDMPAAPTDLVGVYSGSSIVLTWNELDEHNVSLYRIFRSEGGEFRLIGESTTPAFTDRDIKEDRNYSYRVSAVTDSEGPMSEVIHISTQKNPK